ncbi:MAG: bifunctional metallophosphatase/5'-nucleotidase [Armatimonadota bacterium]|nr:bifunctional metallophosphatase/5'-nucleotidase [Armatimonadota bacterium]
MKLTRRQFLSASLASAAVAPWFAGCVRRPEVVRILWTNDTHGQLVPIYHREAYGPEFLKENGIAWGSVEAYLTSSVDFLSLARRYGKVGGYAYLSALIQKERAAYPGRTLLLDAGDAWYGSAIALLTEGRAVVEVMNAMGYDAMTLHWEFNLGKEVLLARIREAAFPVLAQNLVDTDFEDRVLKASIVKDLEGIRVAVVGQAYPFSLLTTERRDANPGWRMGYREEALQEEIWRVRKEEGAQIVILLSHMGYAQDRVFAERIEGVDVIVGGHTHDILWQPVRVGRTLIVQAGSHGKLLGSLDLQVRGGKIVGFRHTLLPVLPQRIDPDPAIERLITELYAPYRDRLGRVIGEAHSLLYRRHLYGGTTDAFLVEAYREIMDADLGCAPGWRFGTTLLPGPITVEDVYNAMKPTPSPLYRARLSGRRIRQAIEDNLDNVFNPDPLQRLGGDVLRCAGARVWFRKENPRGSRVLQMEVNGRPLTEDQMYTVATSGGRTQYMDSQPSQTERPAVEEIIAYIAKRRLIQAERLQTFVEVS